MLCQFRLHSVAAARGNRPEPGSGILRRRLPAGRRGSAQLLFDSLAEVLEQMKTVGDLPRLRRSPAGSLGIEAAAIRPTISTLADIHQIAAGLFAICPGSAF